MINQFSAAILLIANLSTIACFVRTLPLDIQSNAGKTLLFSDKEKLRCCDQDLTFVGNTAILNIDKCIDSIKCDEIEWEKTILKTNCKEVQMEYGCATSKSNYHNNTAFVKCFCTSHGLICPSGIYEADCKSLEEVYITSEDELIYIKDSDVKLKTMLLTEYHMPVYPNGTNLKMKFSYKMISDNEMKIKVTNAVDLTCSVYDSKELIHYSCKEDPCEFVVDVEGAGNVNKKLITVLCGVTKHNFWLFRESSNINGFVESHSHWRSHSKILGTIFIVNIAFGFIIIELLIYIFMFISKFVSYMYNFILFKMLDWREASNDDSYCVYCDYYSSSLYEAMMHQDYCHKDLCPYCLKYIPDMRNTHVNNCDKKLHAIQNYKDQNEVDIRETLSAIASDVRIRVSNTNVKKITLNIWSSSLVIMLVFLIITPAEGLMSKPCNKMVGRTTDCKQRSSDQILKSPLNEHTHYSSEELGLIDNLIKENNDNEFSYNALHRLKSRQFLNGESSNSIVMNSGICGSKGSCTGYADIEWSDQVFAGAIQTYKTSNKDKLESTFSIFIPDAQVNIFLDYMYSTTEWDIQKEQHFSCTETDCSKVCKKPKDKCPVLSKQRSADSSWKHNPLWCLSISSGCSCINSKIIPKDSSPIYNIYKLGKKQLEALICIEQNNIYIDCINVDKQGEKEFHFGKAIIRSWNVDLELPKIIIVKINPGSNNTNTIAHEGPICEVANCNIGDAGDYQFKNVSNFQEFCQNDVYFKANQITADLRYGFGMTPIWDITHPSPGAEQIEHYNTLLEDVRLVNHNVDLKAGVLTVKGESMGNFNIRFNIKNIEMFSINDPFEVSEFKVENCQGYYMSEIGVICTFKINMSKGSRSVVQLKTGDDNNFIQQDSQVITKGVNYVRKFMYTRSKQPNYKFCLYHKRDKIQCSSVKYNLTEPSLKWKILDYQNNYIKSNDKVKTCEVWFGVYCMAVRFIDSFKTIYSGLYLIAIGIAVFLVYTILKKLILKLKDRDWLQDIPVYKKLEKPDLKKRLKRLKHLKH